MRDADAAWKTVLVDWRSTPYFGALSAYVVVRRAQPIFTGVLEAALPVYNWLGYTDPEGSDSLWLVRGIEEN